MSYWETRVQFKTIPWRSHVWVAPDGKEVPYDTVNLLELIYGPDPDWDPNGVVQEIVITRWPRKVTIDYVETEGIEDYTQDGDGDGLIWIPMSRRKVNLMITDRLALMSFFYEILDEVEDKYCKIRSL